MKKYLLIFLAVSALAVFSAAAFAAEEPPVPGKMKMMGREAAPGMMQGRQRTEARKNMMEGLDLSEDQKEKLKNFRLEHRKQIIKLKSDIEIKEIDLRDEMLNKEVNRGRIKNLIDDITKLKGELERLKVEQILKTREILTGEQFNKFRDNHLNEQGSSMNLDE